MPTRSGPPLASGSDRSRLGRSTRLLKRVLSKPALLAALLLVTAAIAVSPGLAAAGGTKDAPWVDGFMTAPAESVLAAAAEIDAAENAISVFWNERSYRLDAAGRLVDRRRLVYRINHRDAIDGWGSISGRWAPWHQAQPRLRARVISPQGDVRELDPATLSEHTEDAGEDLYSDRKILEGPLPTLAVGSIVEEEVVEWDLQPFWQAGVVAGHALDWWFPLEQGRVVLEYPASLPVRFEIAGFDQEAVVAREGKKHRVLLEYGRMAARTPSTPNLMPNQSRRPTFRFSTGESWQAIATSYRARVEEALADADVRQIAQRVRKSKGDAQAKVAAALAWVHEQVRYTGLELGQSSLVPYTPKQTIARGYGDCKDQATLLVAVLREAGLPADVALLNAGIGEDVSPGLPGLGRFNHAIVRVSPAGADAQAIWVDPTSRYSPAGELPVGDQGRLALVARADSESLELTPEASATINRVTEHRVVTMSEHGPGKVTERTVYRGEQARAMRPNYEGISTEDAAAALYDYIAHHYRGESVTDLAFTDPGEVDEPFEMSFAVPEARRFITDLDEAIAVLTWEPLFHRVPRPLLSAELAPRTEPFFLAVPFRYELRHEISAPPGMVVRGELEDEEVDLGGGSWSVRYKQREDHGVDVSMTLQLSKRAYSPEEFEALRTHLRSISDQEWPRIWFEHEAARRADNGDLRGALEVHRNILSADPNRAVHHVRYASTLLEAGMRGAALRHAQRAVELAPESSLASWSLGNVLEHGDNGLPFSEGFDWSGAQSALSRAVELDPSSQLARAEYAIFLDYDEEGTQFGETADLDLAVREQQAFREEFGNHALDVNILVGMFRRGRYDELLEVSEGYAPSDARNSLRVASLAASRGAEKAIEEARAASKNSESLMTVVDSAVVELISAGLYQESAALLQRAMPMADNPAGLTARIGILERAQPLDEVVGQASEPRDLYIRLLYLMTQSETDEAALRELLHPRLLALIASSGEEGDGLEALAELGADLVASGLANVTANGMGLERVLEIARASLTGKTVGSLRGGQLVHLSASFSASELRFVLLEHEGEPRFLAVDGQADALALEVLELIEAGDTEGAREFFEWTTKLVPDEVSSDAWRDGNFAWFARDALSVEGTSEIEIAAAALVSEGLAPERGAAVLERALERAETLGAEPERIERLRASLSRSYVRMGRHQAALASAAASTSTSKALYALRSGALSELERWDELEAMAKSALASHSLDGLAHFTLGHVALERGQLETSLESIERYLEQEPGNTAALNQLAWLELFRDRQASRAIELAERAALLSEYGNYAVLHTLASAYALRGEPESAHKIMLQALNLKGEGAEADDWFVFGRIAEEYELEQDARAYYELALAGDEGDGYETARLAERALDRLSPAAESDKKRRRR